MAVFLSHPSLCFWNCSSTLFASIELNCNPRNKPEDWCFAFSGRGGDSYAFLILNNPFKGSATHSVISFWACLHLVRGYTDVLVAFTLHYAGVPSMQSQVRAC